MDERVRWALKYIEENLDKKLTLGAIASHLGLSRIYFCFLFKKEMKTGFRTYIIDRKIHIAKELLKNTWLPIKTISFNTGFKSVSAFCHQFKRRTGLTPIIYRRKAKKKSY